MRKLKAAWPAALWALLLLPFFLGAAAAHPATDDFTFAVYTHPTWLSTGSLLHVLKDALSYTLRTWRDWQGTMTGVLIMTLNPAVFSLKHYGVHAVILLALHLASWFVFLRHMLKNRLGLPGRLFVPLFFALSAMGLLFLPDIVEGIYWFNGAWFYTGAQAAALLTLTLCDVLCAYRGARARQAGLFALAAMLLFALGMDNYITAMMTLAALLMMALQRAWAGERRCALRTAALLLPIGVGLLLSVIAPGNSVRMETDGAHQSGMVWLLSSIAWTLRDAAKYVVRFLTKTPLLALLAAATPALLAAVKDEAMREKARRCPPVWASVLGVYLVLCAMIIPHMYSSGYAGSGRVVNMYHLYVVIAVPAAYIMILMRLTDAQRQKLDGKTGRAVFMLLCAAALLLCVSGRQLGGYVKLASDQLDGTQRAYIAQIENEYALCEAAGEGDQVILPPWTVHTMTGKPTAEEDETMWTNEAMALYFGVGSVKVVP